MAPARARPARRCRRRAGCSSPAPANSEVTSIASGRITSRVSSRRRWRSARRGRPPRSRRRRSISAICRSVGSSSRLWTLNPSTSSVVPAALPIADGVDAHTAVGRGTGSLERSGDWLFSPSVSSTIDRRTRTYRAGTGVGSGVGSGRLVRSSSPRPGPPRPSRSWSARSGCRARSTCRARAPGGRSPRSPWSASFVGTWIEKPLSLNATTPIRTDVGWRSTNVRAAALAASIRVGARSSAAMLPETSKAG